MLSRRPRAPPSDSSGTASRPSPPLFNRVRGRGVLRSSLSPFCITLSRRGDVQLVSPWRSEVGAQHMDSVHKDAPRRMPHLRGGRYSSFASWRVSRSIPASTPDEGVRPALRSTKGYPETYLGISRPNPTRSGAASSLTSRPSAANSSPRSPTNKSRSSHQQVHQ